MLGPEVVDRRDPTHERRSGVRTDIQLLRAFAVLAVVVNHLAPNRLTGGYLGVDVFFVISGFLITSHLVSELEREGRVRLGRFWARRARRLLPASLLVLAACAAATVVWLPQTRWTQVMDEILASALYFQNWELAASAQDYFTSAQTASPVTHFWSLSVEEQFYLVWPLLVFGIWWLVSRRTRTASLGASRHVRRRTLAIVLAALGVASLCFAAWSVGAHPDAAYFMTPGRVWEFAAGGTLAALAATAPAPGRRGRLLAVPGWIVMAGSVWLFGEDSGVPGPLTLLPVAGCALVIWSGRASAGEAVPSALRAPVWIGDISYSVYLWHWPLIVFAPYALQRPMTPAMAVGIFAATLAVAHLSTRFVEDPARRAKVLVARSSAVSLVAAGVAMAAVAGAAAYVPTTIAKDLATVQEQMEALVDSGGPCVGAAAASATCPDSHAPAIANASLLTIVNSPYYPAWGATCQVEPEDPEPAPCQFGVPPEDAGHRLALVGDSHAGHWAAPLDVIARERGWNVTMQVKSSCLPAGGDLRASWASEPMVASCNEWGDVVGTALADDPDLDVIVMSGISRDYASDAAGGVVRHLRALWARWVDAGKQVVVIADPPALGLGSLPDCLAVTTTRDPCTAPTQDVLTPDPLVKAARGQRGVTLVDLTDVMCDRRRCHAVVGGIPVYGDQNHLLQYFARTLAPLVAERLATMPGLRDGQGR
ncbi:acyltransferase family protein [uncultured Nocardioides sp.]|uniref:acyltransferase family protein n=1 Tax=uncultured Nocardioides sp. TaxID=198441 RepID=UPI002602ABC2|nr:acyltransferase family protein [uncultured Nocardioides sp.]